MKPLTLKLRATPPCLLDGSPLAPQVLAGKSHDQIARIALQGWNAPIAVGDLFSASGDDAERIVLESLDGSLVRVGAGLEGGELTVIGHSGDYTGESMRGGTLAIRGQAGAYLGAGMRGGTLSVTGNAGDFAGSARAGEMSGMTGGCILIRGDARDRAGDRMRRGLLLIEGSVGSYCAARMVAGTIAVLGRTGSHAGYLMRRGTLLLEDPAAEPLPTFNHNGRSELLAIRLLLDSLAARGPAFRRFARRRVFDRWLGDLGCEGIGELLIAQE